MLNDLNISQFRDFLMEIEFAYFEEIARKNKIKYAIISSIYMLNNELEDIIMTGRVEIISTSGAVYNRQYKPTHLLDPTLLDIWKAVDKQIKQTGDIDHRFIEDINIKTPGEIHIHLGS